MDSVKQKESASGEKRFQNDSQQAEVLKAIATIPHNLTDLDA